MTHHDAARQDPHIAHGLKGSGSCVESMAVLQHGAPQSEGACEREVPVEVGHTCPAADRHEQLDCKVMYRILCTVLHSKKMLHGNSDCRMDAFYA